MKRGDVVKRVDIDHIREIERESNRLLNEKKWAEAEMVLRKALEVTPMLVPAINNLAFCLFMQDNPEEALEVLRPNLSANVPNPFASALASQICVAIGRMDEAEKHLETAVRSFDAGLPQMRLAPSAISNPWYEYLFGNRKVHSSAVKKCIGYHHARGRISGPYWAGSFL